MYIGALWLLVTLTSLGACSDGQAEQCAWADSLNVQVYREKYASLDAAMQTVDSVMAVCEAIGYQDGWHEAWLNKGDVYGMRMDYDSAQLCYQTVLKESDNDLLRGIADVDMMSVCLMRSMSKEFYDYWSDAQERFSHVAEDQEHMSEHQRMLWNAVQTECHFVAVNYSMKMRLDEGVKREFDWLEQHQDLFAEDTTQLAAYLVLRSMYGVREGQTVDAVDEMQRNQVRLLSLSRNHGYAYFEALALNALARSLVSGMEMKPSRRVFVAEMMGESSDDSLAYRLAHRAAQLARQYGNAFVETAALTTLSDYYLQTGTDSLALQCMVQALDLVNTHHRRVNKGVQNNDVLVPYAEDMDSLSTEMRWIADPTVIAVPDWMAGVREQLSIVFGAMGRKAESDYNHNIYFDILDATRQDLRVQQEEDNLKREERTLNLLLWGFIVLMVAMGWTLWVYNRKSRHEYRMKVQKLSRVIAICKRLSSALTDDIEDEESLDEALHLVADDEVVALFPQYAGQDWTAADVDTLQEAKGKVSDHELKGLDHELLRVLRVFYAWMRQNGLQFVQFVEEKRRLESESYLFGKRLEAHKQQYLEKLTSLSIVQGITPFLDRALHEVNKLKSGQQEDEETLRKRFLYLSELVDKINEYNDVLGHWVKIRQGVVTLHVENFALRPLFDTLRHGEKTFANKGVALQVSPTDSVVKADLALTLFMMNTLLDNARKYTPSGGRVTLSAEETDSYVEISVHDTGPGMSPADVETLLHSKVYDSSKIGLQGDHAADIVKNKGFGFGLMNCKGIIERYKKTNQLFHVCLFGVESQVGQGSRFFFRLPKGVMKLLVILLWWSLSFPIIAVDASSQSTHPIHQTSSLEQAAQYADSVFAANVRGQYEDAILYADSALRCLSVSYQQAHPDMPRPLQLEKGEMAELAWWREGFATDYELIIRLRNEVAIAALALNRNGLYHYNSEVFTCLYKLLSTDPTLEEYCNHIKQANRNKKTAVILLGMLMLVVLVVYFFLHYRHHQLFLFNLRQFIQLCNNVFTVAEPQRLQCLHQGLADIKPVEFVGMMIPQGGDGAQGRFTFSGQVSEPHVYESLMCSAYAQHTEVVGAGGRFHAYPLTLAHADDEHLTGVLGVQFSDGTLTNDERLIVDLVVQFLSIHAYFSYLKVGEMDESLELMHDERRRLENEQQKVYVRNQIMDNSLSALKHETMYYPSRIKQLVDAALTGGCGTMDPSLVTDIDELLSYYNEVFTLLSQCAGKQVEQTLFRRERLSAHDIVDMVQRSFRKVSHRQATLVQLQVSATPDIHVQGDRIFLQVLVDNIVSLFFEHHSGGNLLVDFAVSDGFAIFAFTDTTYRYADTDIPRLFYVENVHYDKSTDTLTGTQYLIGRQIIREHDAHASRRGCRLYVENLPDNAGARFVFTLPAV